MFLFLGCLFLVAIFSRFGHTADVSWQSFGQDRIKTTEMEKFIANSGALEQDKNFVLRLNLIEIAWLDSEKTKCLILLNYLYGAMPAYFFAALLLENEIPVELKRLGQLRFYLADGIGTNASRARNYVRAEAVLYWNWNPYAFLEAWIYGPSITDERDQRQVVVWDFSLDPDLKLYRFWKIEVRQKMVGIFCKGAGVIRQCRFVTATLPKSAGIQINKLGTIYNTQAEAETELAQHLVQPQAYLMDNWLDDATARRRFFPDDTLNPILNFMKEGCKNKTAPGFAGSKITFLRLKPAAYDGSKILALFDVAAVDPSSNSFSKITADSRYALVGITKSDKNNTMELDHISFPTGLNLKSDAKAEDVYFQFVQHYYTLAFTDAFRNEPWVRHFDLYKHPTWAGIDSDAFKRKIRDAAPFSVVNKYTVGDVPEIFLQVVRKYSETSNSSIGIYSYDGQLFIVDFDHGNTNGRSLNVGTLGTVNEASLDCQPINDDPTFVDGLKAFAIPPWSECFYNIFEDMKQKSTTLHQKWGQLDSWDVLNKWIDVEGVRNVQAPRSPIRETAKIIWCSILFKCPIEVNRGQPLSSEPDQFFYAIAVFKDGNYLKTLSVTKDPFALGSRQTVTNQLQTFLREAHDLAISYAKLIPKYDSA